MRYVSRNPDEIKATVVDTKVITEIVPTEKGDYVVRWKHHLFDCHDTVWGLFDATNPPFEVSDAGIEAKEVACEICGRYGIPQFNAYRYDHLA